MKKLAAAIILSICLNSISFAQEEKALSELQFQFKLTETISFAYLKDYGTYSWRFSTDLTIGFRDGNTEYKNIYSTNANVRESESDGNYQAVSLNAQILFDYPLSSKVKFYYGVGPFVSYNRSYSSEETRIVLQDQINSYENRNNGYQIGLVGTIGISCEVSEPLSFIIEYNANGGYQRTKYNYSSETKSQSYNSNNSTEEINKNWIFDLGGIKLGVAVKL